MKGNQLHTVLEVKNLSIGYKKSLIQEGISFKLLSGELMAIVGANGIGKSTLLRTLAKMQPKLLGSILINENDQESYAQKDLASIISVVLTESVASKNLTVSELIALGRQPYTNWIGTLSKVDKQKVDEAIALLELGALKNKKCYQLSDGQLQRVLIARALAQDTSVILLDEPTTHLDIYHKVQLLKLLKSIATQTNKTVLFTSHEIEMAIQLCDKMLLLGNDSRSFGTPENLITHKAFDQLFPSDTVSFDTNTRTFRIEK